MTDTVRFHRLQPIPPAHPRPWFPTLPVVGRSGQAVGAFHADSRFLASDALLLPSGKVATYWALKNAAVRAGDQVAVPAYHCPTMIYPILALGARPAFLSVGPQLEIDPKDVARALRDGARALILPHFFGFVQPQVDEIQRLCRAAGAALIEDCAHAMFARRGSRLPGSWGDYAITSTRKFIAGSEGGALIGNGHPIEHPRLGASVSDEIRGIWRQLHEVRQFGTLPLLGWADHRRSSLSIGPSDTDQSLREAAPSAPDQEEIRASSEDRLALRTVQWMVRHADHDHIAAVRRRRFQRWVDAVSDCAEVEIFSRSLGDDWVPYVFPVRLKRPQEQFRALKYRGVAVWRWDHLVQSECEVSARLAIELIQMPCQHSMSDAAFDRLIGEFLRAVATR